MHGGTRGKKIGGGRGGELVFVGSWSMNPSCSHDCQTGYEALALLCSRWLVSRCCSGGY